MWIKYAHSVSDQRDVFEYMNSLGIGSQSSDFWKAYADYFETIVRDFKEASDLYVTGVATIQNELERNKLLDLMNRFSNRMDLRL